MAGNEVHPYHLLRYDRAMFSQPAIEKLQDSLKSSSQREHKPAEEAEEAAATRRRTRLKSGGGGVMKSAYQIIRRPVITEKGLAVKETEDTLVFQVARKATKTEIKKAVQSDFQGEGGFGAHRQLRGQRAPPRASFAGYRPDWKKAYVRLKAGEKMPEYAQNL